MADDQDDTEPVTLAVVNQLLYDMRRELIRNLAATTRQCMDQLQPDLKQCQAGLTKVDDFEAALLAAAPKMTDNFNAMTAYIKYNYKLLLDVIFRVQQLEKAEKIRKDGATASADGDG